MLWVALCGQALLVHRPVRCHSRHAWRETSLRMTLCLRKKNSPRDSSLSAGCNSRPCAINLIRSGLISVMFSTSAVSASAKSAAVQLSCRWYRRLASSVCTTAMRTMLDCVE